MKIEIGQGCGRVNVVMRSRVKCSVAKLIRFAIQPARNPVDEKFHALLYEMSINDSDWIPKFGVWKKAFIIRSVYLAGVAIIDDISSVAAYIVRFLREQSGQAKSRKQSIVDSTDFSLLIGGCRNDLSFAQRTVISVDIGC
jgi:hypothetical protein